MKSKILKKDPVHGDLVLLYIGSMTVVAQAEPDKKVAAFCRRIDKAMRGVSQKVLQTRGRASLTARTIILPCSVLVGRTRKGA